VEFVLGCMHEKGGQSYDTLYPCVCLIDRIAAAMSYAEFAQAQVFAQEGELEAQEVLGDLQRIEFHDLAGPLERTPSRKEIREAGRTALFNSAVLGGGLDRPSRWSPKPFSPS
jgi:hypothetical protein